jgi:PAS domain S-box-containing protein
VLGLSGRLVLVTGAVFLVFVMGLVGLSLRSFRQQNEQTIGQQQLLLATAVAGEIDAALLQARAALERSAAALPASLLGEPQAASRRLSEQGGLQAIFDDGVALLDRQGRVVATTAPDAAAALASVLQAETPGGAPFSRPFPSARAGGRPAIGITAPIRDDAGAVVGHLVGGLVVIGPGLASRFAAMRLGQGGYFSLVTSDRIVLMHADPDRILRFGGPAGVNLAVDRGLEGFEGWLPTRTAAGVEMLTAVKRVPTTGWLLAANYPQADANEPFQRARAWYLLLAGAGALALVGLVWLTARRLTRPLTEMTRQVEVLAAVGGAGQVASGQLGEVETLARAIRGLAAERGRALAELRSSEERFRLAFKTSPEPLTLTNMETGLVVEVNDGFLRLHGLTEAQVVGRTTAELGLWVDQAERDAIVEDVKRHGESRGRHVRVRDAGGEIRTLVFSSSRIDVGGVPHRLSIGRDVTEEVRAATERARLEGELRESEARYRSVVRSLPVVQWTIGRDHRFTLSVGQGLGLLGLREGEVVGKSVFEVYADQPQILEDYRRALAGETFLTIDDVGQVVFESHWGPLRDETGAVVGVTGLALDVTAKRRAEKTRQESEERLAILERLAAMGRLAAGVAHEINNPLAYLVASLDLAAERVRTGQGTETLPSLLDDARDGAQRVRHIVGDLRVFARTGEEAGRSCDAAAVVRSALNLVQNEIRHRAQLDVRLEPAPPVAIAEHRLAQVLVNLLTNACHAIPEGRAADNRIRVTVAPAGERVAIEVTDSGAGMTPEVRQRIFEPFFSTRQVGDGMGLGLALSHAMVAEVGGEIEVRTAPGRGTTFRLLLPTAASAAAAPTAQAEAPVQAAPPAQAEAPRPAPATGRALRVLVIDDEPMVGRAVSRMLSGHSVEVVTSAGQALERVRAGQRYDAFVCDLMMPDVTGMDLYEQLVAEAPDQAARFVFLTGGAFTERARAFVEQPGVRVLPKPMDPGALRAAISGLGPLPS